MRWLPVALVALAACETPDEGLLPGTFVFHVERVAPYSDALDGGPAVFVSVAVDGRKIASTSTREGLPPLAFGEDLVVDLDAGASLDFFLHVADEAGDFPAVLSYGWQSVNEPIAASILAGGSSTWLHFTAERVE